MNRIHNIIEYIRSCGDFPFDTDHVLGKLNDIIFSYGIVCILDSGEYYMLMEELLDLAIRSEIREAVRWANWQLQCGQDSGIDYRIPGYI
ncbi:hypothetical protein GF312_04330 [Candidatus Poribacteria bacterium]|nr:hypothetical protein [Candidatus Poribacteria bacterium]